MIPGWASRSGLVVIAGLLAALPARTNEISVSLWGQVLGGAPYAVALEKRLFEKAGITITGILGSTGGGTTVRNVLAAGLPYGEVALPAAIAAINQGFDIKLVNG